MTIAKSKCFVLPTVFRGIKYRSRLEARWAVFMYLLRVPFQYEPEGYYLDGICYLPDFFLPEQGVFYEIKPPQTKPETWKKAKRLSMFTGKSVLVRCGDTSFPDGVNYDAEGITIISPEGEDYHYLWCECPHCHRCEMQFDGRADRIECGCPKSEHGDKGYNYETDRLIHAYELASNHQFK